MARKALTPEEREQRRVANNEKARRERAENGDAVRARYREYAKSPKYKAMKRADYERNKAKRTAQSTERFHRLKPTIYAQQRAWRARNKDRINANQREKRATNPAVAKAYRDAQKRHYAKHPGKRREQYLKSYDPAKHRERYNTDPKFKMMRLLRSRLRLLVKKKKTGKAASTAELCGCTFDQFVAHIERLFQDGMTWENHGFGPGFWNVDHIRPIASFDLTLPEHQRECFHFSNLQPLWHEDNAEKGAKAA